jgi:uncharacterized protein YgiM (DUF1202 family)
MNNKKTFQLLTLIIISLLIISCGSFSVLPTATPIPPTNTPVPPTKTPVPPTAVPTNTTIPTPTATQVSSEAVVNVESLSVRLGPGPQYPLLAYAVRGDKFTILGQVNNCAWLKVSTADGKTGWVGATYVTYELACGEIAQAEIPPMPTAPQAQSTKAGSGAGAGSCAATDSIVVKNGTNTGLYITLSGPATYSQLLTSGSTKTIPVCPGSYTWMASGCGGKGSGSGSVHSGGSLELACY